MTIKRFTNMLKTQTRNAAKSPHYNTRAKIQTEKSNRHFVEENRRAIIYIRKYTTI